MDTKDKQCRRKNIEESLNIFGRLFFGWTVPVLLKGAKRDLQLTDLYDPLKSDESERLGDRLEREWKRELKKANQEFTLRKDGKKKRIKQPNLLWAIARIFWFPYMMYGFLILFQAVVLRVMQPILQGWIISYFNPGQNTMTQSQGILYVTFLVLASLGSIFIVHHTALRTEQVMMCVRVACCSLVYRKILRLNQTAVNNTAVGKVANLISNDVARFDMVSFYLHYIWITPIQVSLMGYLMWNSVGIAAITGMTLMIIQNLPIQGYMSRISAKLRSKIAAKTDERVQLMSELISGIQVVKMYSWEKPFQSIVVKLRATELKLISVTSYLRGLYLSIIVFSEKVSLYGTLICFILMGNPLTAETTYVVAGLLNALTITCSIAFPFGIFVAGETSISLKRLTEFLLLDEVVSPKKIESVGNDSIKDSSDAIETQLHEYGVNINMNNIFANWIHGQLPPTLHDVSIKISNQSLCVLVGPVGSGKSSLLHLVLGELPVKAGKLLLSTGENNKIIISSRDIRISYASQQPWLFSASIRDNILFGQPYDEQRYQEVTSVCALLKDFEQLPRGDLSFVGERGASLSGGQRARINLARAVYRDADLYLLDDPLSAVDPRVGRHLFEECITGFLEGKTRILATHQLQYLQDADNIAVLNRGAVEYQGSYEGLTKSKLHILESLQDSDKSSTDEHGKENYKEDVESETSVVTVNNKTDQQSKVNEGIESSEKVDEEEVARGKMSNKVYLGYFLAGGNMCSLALLTVVFIIGQVASSGTDYWVTYWINVETLRVALKMNKSNINDVDYLNETTSDDQERILIESQWFDKYGLVHPTFGIYIYTVCIIVCILFITLRSFLFVGMCVRASRNIHNSMFANLLQATMRFFYTNPAGRILNRFSKDIGAMDEILPRTILDALQILTVMIGILTMVTLANYWMIFPAITMSGIFYVIRVFYLKTAQDVKRLEGITKSPVFSHVNSTLDGLITIRSRGPLLKKLLQGEFDRYQDLHTSAWYLNISTANAFGFFLDLISCSFIACVCFSFILMNNGNIAGGFVGLAISQSLILTGMVQEGIRQSAEVISQMTSVERLLQYTELPKEGPFTTENLPPPTWPSKGALVFKNVTMKYADNKPPVLKNINLNIKPGWKIGIVGRTGAGKSSLISALFRLTDEGLDGAIIIDGIDTKTIGLHELRPRISIIPQEPILFSASLRHNLDPFEKYTDSELWNSLKEVELGDTIPSLDFQVAGGGINFSVGQRQLICLARAILRNNKLLVLDEATANIDRHTDTLIQNTIRRRFANCTVLTIAHRLNTIMDSDRVLVMDGGFVVEFDHPYLLLKNPDGHFSKMVEQTGKNMSGKLAEISKNAFLLNPEFKEQFNDETIPNYDD